MELFYWASVFLVGFSVLVLQTNSQEIQCRRPLGMETRFIKDAQITASSQYDSNHAAIQARLNLQAGGDKAGAWSAGSYDVNKWIQVALSSYTKLTGIATQGRNGYSQWVTKYQLQYSDDGVKFHYYKEPGQSSPKVFNGNKDRDSIVYHKLKPPIQASYIRLRPTAWYVYISLRMELYGCLVLCSASLGMESRVIKDAQITASSEHDANHAAIQARLNFTAGGGKQGAWSARSNDASQWIQVDLGGFTNITGIATQGRSGVNQWVTKYQLQYSDDGVNFHSYKALCEKLPEVLNGNKDTDSIVYHQLNPLIQARYIRLRPTAWSSHISLRMELYGCLAVPCTASLGMENRLIKDAQITASSEHDSNHAAIQARLNFKAAGGKQGAWSAGSNNANQWIQVALDGLMTLTGIATQGRNDVNQWVTKYKLQYSGDGVNFHYYKEPGQSSPKVFNGNNDRDNIVYHKLNPPIHASYIRLRPTAWSSHISMRMELYGCLGPCTASLGMESRLIEDAQITASSEYGSGYAAIQARLNFKAGGGKHGAWSTSSNDAKQWIQVAFDSFTTLTGIATQGRNDYNQWVTKYQLQYGDDGMNFHHYKELCEILPKVFEGNKDRESIVYHKLNPPFQARYVRLRPTSWYGHISMRMELYGCLAVGNATHPGSRGNRRRREASDHLTNGYSLAEDLSHLTRRKREGKREKDLDKSDM